MDTPLQVAIVGGGIGGLAAAVALQQAGVHCTVFERDPYFGFRKEGFGLTLTNNEKGPLATLGILTDCVNADCPSVCHWIFSPRGSVLGYYGRYFKDIIRIGEEGAASCSRAAAMKTGDRGNLRVPRQDLRQLLLQRVAPETVKWGHQLTDIVDDPAEEKVSLCFSNGAEYWAHMVVGADGIHSAVRRIRDSCVQTCKGNGPSTQPVDPCALQYIGVAVIIGISPVTSPLLDNQGFYVLDGTHRLFTMPFRSPGSEKGDVGLTMWQLSFSGLKEADALSLKTASPETLIQEALSRTAEWFGVVNEMIRCTIPADVWATPLYDRIPPLTSRKKECRSRLTVIGDACHPMSMFKGQGANQALQDAVLLARWVGGDMVESLDGSEQDPRQKRRRMHRSTSDLTLLSTRIRCFEREMVSRAGPKVVASREAAQTYHSAAALDVQYGIEGLKEFPMDSHHDHDGMFTQPSIVRYCMMLRSCNLDISVSKEDFRPHGCLEKMIWNRYKRTLNSRDVQLEVCVSDNKTIATG